MATALETLGSICHAQKKMKDARRYYKTALKMKDKIYGDAKWSDISSRYGGMSGGDITDRSAVTSTTDDDESDDNDSDCDLNSDSGVRTGDENSPLLAQSQHRHNQEYGVELIPVDAQSKAKATSENDAKMARTLHRLGVMSWNLGNLKQAEDYFDKTLELQEKAFGENADNEDIAITLFSLGGLCNDLHNDQVKACTFYRRALDCYYAVYGQNAHNESIAQLLHALGQSLLAQNESEEARSCLKNVSIVYWPVVYAFYTNADFCTWFIISHFCVFLLTGFGYEICPLWWPQHSQCRPSCDIPRSWQGISRSESD
jgi:hypothetical protein